MAYRPNATVADLLRQFNALNTNRPAAYTPSAALTNAQPGAYTPSQALQDSQPGEYSMSANVDALQDAYRRVQSMQPRNYTPSGNVMALRDEYQRVNNSRPGEYQSQWSEQLGNLYNQIANRPAFQYDLNADMLYQQYKDQYTLGGRQAMQDTMGQASALTGGYGNSYAQTAGQQAYQGYLQQLNNVIPQLEDRAYGRYRDEGQDLYNLYGLTAGNEDRDYGRYRDSMADWRDDRSFAYGAYSDERGFDYGQYRDRVSDWRDDRSFAYGAYTDERGFDYGQYRDSVADWRDDRSFEYGQYRDSVADWRDDRSFDYGQYRDSVSDWNADRGFAYDLYSNERTWDAQQQAAAAAAARSGGTGRSSSGLDPALLARMAGIYQQQGTGMLDRTLEDMVTAGLSPRDAANVRGAVISNVPYTNSSMVLPGLRPNQQNMLNNYAPAVLPDLSRFRR